MTTNYERWIFVGEKLGYTDTELRRFVTDKQAEERDEREKDREAKAEERREKAELREIEARNREMEMNEREKTREYELRRLELKAQVKGETETEHSHVSYAKTPKLPEYKEKDNMDAYLERFERFAVSQKWEPNTWSINLSALLTGKALEVYSRMPTKDAFDYNKLKQALLLRFQFTEEGFRRRFRESKSEDGETPLQYIVRLGMYLTRWIELTKTDQTYEGLFELIVKEQFLNVCDQELATYLREKTEANVNELAEYAERYLEAHSRTLNVSTNKKSGQKCESKCF